MAPMQFSFLKLKCLIYSSHIKREQVGLISLVLVFLEHPVEHSVYTWAAMS